MADPGNHGPDTAACSRGRGGHGPLPPPPSLLPPPPRLPLSPAGPVGVGSASWPDPAGRHPGSRAGVGALEGHIRGHFLLSVLIHGLVPSSAREEFPVPCLSSRAWGHCGKGVSADVRAGGRGSTEPQSRGVFSCARKRGRLAAPWPRAERKGSCLGRPSGWAGWPGAATPPSHGCPGRHGPSPRWPSLGTGEPAEGTGSRSTDADL